MYHPDKINTIRMVLAQSNLMKQSNLHRRIASDCVESALFVVLQCLFMLSKIEHYVMFGIRPNISADTGCVLHAAGATK